MSLTSTHAGVYLQLLQYRIGRPTPVPKLELKGGLAQSAHIVSLRFTPKQCIKTQHFDSPTSSAYCAMLMNLYKEQVSLDS